MVCAACTRVDKEVVAMDGVWLDVLQIRIQLLALLVMHGIQNERNGGNNQKAHHQAADVYVHAMCARQRAGGHKRDHKGKQ